MFLCHFATTQCFYGTLQPPKFFMQLCKYPMLFLSLCNYQMFLRHLETTKCFCHFATIYGTLNKLNAFMQLCNHPMFFHHFTTTRCFYAALQRLNKCMNASVNPSRYFLWDHKVMWNFWQAVRNGTFWQTCKNTKKCWFKQ